MSSQVHSGFGSRAIPIPDVLAPVWNDRPLWTQTHGSVIREVTKAHDDVGPCDALWTRHSGLPVAIQTADCVPILLIARRQEIPVAVAAIHAGWRGVLNRIFPATVEEIRTRLNSSGQDPIDVEIIFGPHIRACCFEVQEDVRLPFLTTFASLPKTLVSPRPDRIDLQAILLKECEGLSVTSVRTESPCTMCSRTLDGRDWAYNSFRRDRNRDAAKARQFSGIFLTLSE